MKNIFIIIVLSLFFQTDTFSQTGITWQGSGDIASSSFDNLHPRMTMDRSGNPMVIWGKANIQSVYFSKWNGTAFTTPVKLNPPWMYVATAEWMGPDIASHGDTVYVVVKRAPEAADTNRIFIFSSFDAGANFNTPVELAFIADSISRFPTVTTDATGNPIVGFMKFNSLFLESRWAVTRSDDFGITFNTDVRASNWGGSVEVCDCCPGAVLSHGDTTVTLYRDNNNNLRRIWAGFSNDNANTFTSGFNVDNNTWLTLSCPSSGPDGTIINDTLYSVFMNTNSSFISRTSLVSGSLSSMDSLAHFPGLVIQNFPRIASYGNAVGVVWQQFVNGNAELPIRFTNNITSGLPAIYDTVDLNNITNADIAISSDKVFVVWQDDNTGTVKYRVGTYIPVGTGIAENNSEVISLYPNPASNRITIQLTPHVNLERIAIYDMQGKCCLDKMYSGNQTDIDISILNSGIYQVIINTNAGSFVRRFLK